MEKFKAWKARRNPFLCTSHESMLLSRAARLQPRHLLSRLLSSSFPSQSQSLLTQESVLSSLEKLDEAPFEALSFFNSLTTQHAGFSPCSPVYDLMLRILSHKEALPEFWDVLKSMHSTGRSLDHATYQTLLANFKKQKLADECLALELYYNKSTQNTKNDSVSSVALAVLSRENVGKVLEDLKFDFSEHLVVSVLRELQRSPLKALAFFNWVRDNKSEFDPGPDSYQAILWVLGQEESMDKFWEMIGEMKQKGFHLESETYVKISGRLLKRQLFKDAIQLYELMMDGPYQPSRRNCERLLRQIASSPVPDLNLVNRVVRKYRSYGYSLSKPIYDGIHESLTSTGQFDKAEEIMKKMEKDGHKPDNITYSQMVQGLCKVKRLDDARKVLDEMSERGCVADLKTWTVLIQGHCACGEVDKAMELLEDMAEKNLVPDACLFDILVKALCQANRPGEAHAFFVKMVLKKKKRVKPWKASFVFLIQELLKARMIEEALEPFKLLRRHSFPPFWQPFGLQIAKFGTSENAEEFLEALSRDEAAPNVFLELFRCFLEEGRSAEAHKLLHKCPDNIRKHRKIVKLFGYGATTQS